MKPAKQMEEKKMAAEDRQQNERAEDLRRADEAQRIVEMLHELASYDNLGRVREVGKLCMYFRTEQVDRREYRTLLVRDESNGQVLGYSYSPNAVDTADDYMELCEDYFPVDGEGNDIARAMWGGGQQ